MAYWHTYVAQIHAVLGKLRDPTAIARIEFDQITSLMSYHVKVAGIRRKKRPSGSTKNMLRYFEQVLDTAHHKGILDVDFTGRTVGVTPRGHALYKDVLETIGGAYVDDKSNILANLKASQAIFGKYERRRKSEMAAALRRRDKIREVDIRHIRYRQGYDLDPIPEGDIDYNEPSTAVLNFLLPGEHARRMPATPMKSKAKFPNGTPLTKAMSMSYNYCPTPESMPRYRTPIARAHPSPPSSPTPGGSNHMDVDDDDEQSIFPTPLAALDVSRSGTQRTYTEDELQRQVESAVAGLEEELAAANASIFRLEAKIHLFKRTLSDHEAQITALEAERQQLRDFNAGEVERLDDEIAVLNLLRELDGVNCSNLVRQKAAFETETQGKIRKSTNEVEKWKRKANKAKRKAHAILNTLDSDDEDVAMSG